MKTSGCVNKFACKVNNFCTNKIYPNEYTKETCFQTFFSILDFDLMKEKLEIVILR